MVSSFVEKVIAASLGVIRFPHIFHPWAKSCHLCRSMEKKEKTREPLWKCMELVKWCKCLVCVVCYGAGAVISCHRDWREVSATFTAVTGHELRGNGKHFPGYNNSTDALIQRAFDGATYTGNLTPNPSAASLHHTELSYILWIKQALEG